MRNYFRILAYGKPYVWLWLISLGFVVVYTLTHAISLLMIGPFLEMLFNERTVTAGPEPLSFQVDSLKTYLNDQLWYAIQRYGKQTVLPYYCGALIAIMFIKNIARYFGSFFVAPFEQGIIRNMRDDLFQTLSKLSLRYFTGNKKGDIIGKNVSDVQVVQESVIGTVQAVFREPITIVVFVITLSLISWKLTLFTLLILPLTGVAISLIRRSLKRKARAGQQSLGDLISMLDEFVGGVRIVKAFQKEEFEQQRYAAKNEEYTRLQVAIRRQTELASPLTEFLSMIIISAIIVYAGSLILSENSELSGAEFVNFIVMFSMLMNPIKIFSTAVTKIQKGIAAFERIQELLYRKPEIQEVESPVSVSAFEHELQFENVYFRYGKDYVLHDINIHIPKGHTVALVGPSGGGKSTLADLLPRFYDPSEGSILLDGKDLRQLRIQDLRKLMGVVTQEAILFHDTVANNIAYGMEEVDRAAVVAAAKVANAHAFITELTEGYDSMIGERGTMLSGGQRQRISIARAVLRNPPILILDEATSNLDTESERLVQDALIKLMENRTSFVIAHRLSTILSADQIFVVERGRILEHGTHQELLQYNGLYRKLYDLQFEG